MNKCRFVISICTLLIAVLFICYGVSRQEPDIIKNKAVVVCLECIGLGR